MLNIQNLSISFADRTLFNNLNFNLNAGDRIGLIGKNGAGKSTLLKVLAKEILPDDGNILSDKALKIGFLKQDLDFFQGRNVLEEVYQAFSEIKNLEEQIKNLNFQLDKNKDFESQEYLDLIENLSETTNYLKNIGGYNYEGEAEKILLGLGFKREDFFKLTETFSGGWRMRIELAKLLLQNNDILLLDEPNNHLDIDSIIWLENFLKQFKGAVVIISHDKMFLDNVTNRTIEISLGNIYEANKPYSQYLIFRQEIREKQLATQKNQQKQIEQTEKLIEKFRYKATKATMAQSLIKKLDKIEKIEIDEEDNSVMSVNFPVEVNPGKIILEAKNISKNYEDKKIISDISLIIERGKKIAFVGQNGQGKSTFLKIILNEIDYEGKIKLGHNVQIGYFAQNQADYLDLDLTLLETMENAATLENRAKVRSMLGAFLFSGEDVYKKVGVLSGGERNRLALCKMLLSPINVLIMDEPTNHLDIQSKNILKIALKKFAGALILVSHDRDFLQDLIEVIYEFKNQKITEYLGDINFYLEQKKIENSLGIEKIKNQKIKNLNDNKKNENLKSKNKFSFEEQKQEQKQKRALQNKIIKIENQISELEKIIAQDDLIISENTQVLDNSFFQNYNKNKELLNNLFTNWENLQS